MSILSTFQLSKNYGRITALDDLTLKVESGMVYGLLGPNGSGKTTTLGIILGIIHATSGSYSWFDGRYGDNPRRRIGALLETPNFYPGLSAVDNLKIIAHIKRIEQPRMEELLQLVGLAHRQNSAFKTFSLGMKQRLAIAAALIGDPEVLVLDEPTNGLDPQGIAEVRDIVQKIATTGKTIIMASHILDEVEKICSHVAIIKNGHLLATGTVGAILTDDFLVEVSAGRINELQQALSSLPHLSRMEQQDGKLLLYFSEQVAPDRINQAAFDAGIALNHLRHRPRSLESEFLEITREKDNAVQT